MRSVLRTSIVTAALAGALLAPAATALAATAPQSATAVTAAVSANDRYAGEPVYVGNGMVAVLRNETEGPEAWIRYVGDQWKPGDDYMVHVVALVSRQQTTAEAHGASFELTKAQTASPVLVVTTKGVAKSYPLPKGKTGQVCSAEKTQIIGGGMNAKLSMSPDGPRAEIWAAGEDTAFRILDRGFPALPESAGIIARIVNPSGAAPGFEWKTQGGDTPLGRTSFPALPKGCKPNYKVTEEKATDKPAPKPQPTAAASAKPASATTAADVKPQTGAQTVVVPQGGVAAGAEIAAEDTDNTVTLAAGGGLIAILAGLGAAWTARNRTARNRG